MKLPTWAPPFYEDGTVVGEQTAAKSNVVVNMITAIYNAIVGLPVVQLAEYGGATTATAAKNSEAFTNAIEALPARGGVVELGFGQYLHAGVNCKARSNITIRGQGGLSGGGGLGGGIPGVNESATVLTDGRGAGTERSIDMRNGISCGLEHLTVSVYNSAFPAASAIWDLSSQQTPFCRDVTVEATAEAGKTIPGAWGVVLGGISNSGSFIDLTIKGCGVGLVGSLTTLYEGKAPESVAHNFYNFKSYGHQQCAIFNPWWNWNFWGGSIEERRDNKGALNGAGAVEVNRQCYGLHFYGTWIGGDKVSAKETGVQIKWEGNDLLVSGGTLASAETLIECVGACDKVVVDGTMCILATNGIKLHEEVTRVTYAPMKPPPGQPLPTNAIVGTSKVLGWQAQVSRGVAAFTPSTVGDTDVLLTLTTKAELTLAEVLVGGVVVTEAGCAAAAGITTLSVFVRVPSNTACQVKNKTGTLTSVFSSSRAV